MHTRFTYTGPIPIFAFAFQAYMYLYIILFCIIVSPVCAHSSYSTGLAATLQEYLDDVVHTVTRNISSFSDAKLALRDTISKYSWAHPPSLTQVSKSFFNHSRYFGLEHGVS
jgi:hypothetical protein